MRPSKILLLSLLVASGLCAQKLPTAQSTTTLVQELHATAVGALATLNKVVTEDNFAPMGFRSVAEARTATLGTPVLVYTVWLNELKEYQPGTNPAKLLHGGNEVLYPVVSDEQVRSSITLAKVNGAWKAVSFGEPQLAKLLATTRDKMPPRKGSAPSFIVHVRAMNLAFIAHEDGGKLMLTPLYDDPRFDFKPGVSMPAVDVFKKLAPAAKEQNPNVPS